MDTNKLSNQELNRFFERLDRAMFIDNEYKEYAGYDNALPIGFEQTISQPTLVYEMTSILELTKNSKVLEIGTGSGFQTTILAEFAKEVYTVERIKELSWRALQKLMNLGYHNINFKIGDGSEGWLDFAPYDRIIATAAAAEVPVPLTEQLKNGGRMVIPIGPKGQQELLLVQKDDAGNIRKTSKGKVNFVEFKGDYGWKQ